MAKSTQARKPRRRWKMAAGFIIVVVAVVAAIPYALGTSAARRVLLGRVNRILAPGGLEIASFRLSWFRPTRMTGVVLRDHQGESVLSAPLATWDRNLWQILLQPRRGTLVLDQAKLDVERRADGTMDIVDALRPILSKDPRSDLHIQVRRGSLRFRDRGLHEPLTAEPFDATLVIPPAPRPVSWRVRLARTSAPGDPDQLEVRGALHRWQSRAGDPGDLELQVTGHRWPGTFTVAGVVASGRLDGELGVARRSEEWTLSGRAAVLDLDATGPGLAGDHPRLDRIAGAWKVVGSKGTWTIHQLDLRSSLATLKAEGELPVAPGSSARITGEIDLAAAARLLPHTLRIRDGVRLDRGTARMRVQSRNEADRNVWDVEANVSDLVAHGRERTFTLREPATLSTRVLEAGGIFTVERFAVESAFGKVSGEGDLDRGVNWTATFDLNQARRQLHDLVDFGPAEMAGNGRASGDLRRTAEGLEGTIAAELHGLASLPAGDDPAIRLNLKASYRSDADRLDLAAMTLAIPYAGLDAAGSLSDLTGRRLVDLKGTLTPDWEAITAMLARKIDPGVQLSGGSRPFRVHAALGDGSADEVRKTLEGELGVDLTEARFFGLRLGPTPLVFRSKGGEIALDPIDASLNEGRIHLEPEFVQEVEGGATLRLGESSTVRDVRINDAVSHRVLSFVAPVLDRATRASGSVSVAIDHAEFPLGARGGRTANVEGSVVFQDVEFAPGPLVDELNRMIGRNDPRSLRLDEPVALTIADRRVYQRGLAIPLGNLTRIELEGWVDFDRNLALTASVPVTSAMVANIPLLNEIVAGTRIEVPIGGTLDAPKVDRGAANLALKDLGKDLLGRTAVQGAAELFRRMARPRDPNAPPAPPRLSNQERKAQRLQKKAQRRLERGLEP